MLVPLIQLNFFVFARALVEESLTSPEGDIVEDKQDLTRILCGSSSLPWVCHPVTCTVKHLEGKVYFMQTGIDHLNTFEYR